MVEDDGIVSFKRVHQCMCPLDYDHYAVEGTAEAKAAQIIADFYGRGTMEHVLVFSTPDGSRYTLNGKLDFTRISEYDAAMLIAQLKYAEKVICAVQTGRLRAQRDGA